MSYKLRPVDLSQLDRYLNVEDKLDLRQNNIESLEDIQALLRRTKEQNRRVEIMVLTPSQLHTLQQEPSLALMRPAIPASIFGVRLEVRS